MGYTLFVSKLGKKDREVEGRVERWLIESCYRYITICT
jgi:hypothetical protein